MNIVEGLGVYPFFFCVVDLEAAVWRDASGSVSSVAHCGFGDIQERLNWT